jgi:hypothetical protein
MNSGSTGRGRNNDRSHRHIPDASVRPNELFWRALNAVLWREAAKGWLAVAHDDALARNAARGAP